MDSYLCIQNGYIYYLSDRHLNTTRRIFDFTGFLNVRPCIILWLSRSELLNKTENGTAILVVYQSLTFICWLYKKLWTLWLRKKKKWTKFCWLYNFYIKKLLNIIILLWYFGSRAFLWKVTIDKIITDKVLIDIKIGQPEMSSAPKVACIPEVKLISFLSIQWTFCTKNHVSAVTVAEIDEITLAGGQSSNFTF